VLLHLNAAPSDTAEIAPTQRDRHLQHIAEHGRMAWQAGLGCTKRLKAEMGVSRFKQVIGDGLRSHANERQQPRWRSQYVSSTAC